MKQPHSKIKAENTILINALVVMSFFLFTAMTVVIAAILIDKIHIESLKTEMVAPTLFMVGRFSNNKLTNSEKGCLQALFSPIIYVVFWWIYLPMASIKRKKK